jgi:MFS family permease
MDIVEVSIAGSPANRTAEIKRVVVSSVIGTAVEWYDFLIYGTATALVFNRLFFPLSEPALSTIAAFGTYAVGFLARPFGAAIFGHFGDRVGRKNMLVMTIVIMGLERSSSASSPPTTRLASQRRFCSSHCVCSRASALAANGAEPCSWSSRIHRPATAGYSGRWFRSVCPSGMWPRSGCSLRCRQYLNRISWHGVGEFRS